MKQLFRFFTVLLLAAVTSEAWAIDVPKPKTTALQPDVELYILNVGTQLYLGQGEAWGTQATAAKKGLKYILKNKRDDGGVITCLGESGIDDAGNEITELPSGQYWLYSPDINKNGAHSTCRWQDGTCGEEYRCSFTDQTDWDSRGIWQIASVGNNTYTLQVPSNLPTTDLYLTFQNLYVEGEFAGVWPEHGSLWAQNNNNGLSYGLYSDIVYTDHPEACQWQFVLAADYAIYSAKCELAELAEEAKGYGIDTSAAEALIANENATLEDVQDMIANLKEVLNSLASRDNPAVILNLNGDNGSDMPGWTTSTNPSYEASSFCWEFWNVSGSPYIEYPLPNMPAGLYRLAAQAYTRTDMHGVLTFGANSMEIATVSSDKVNNRTQGLAWFKEGNGLNVMTAETTEPSDLTIRLTADGSKSDYWTVWHSFTLTYYGNQESDYRAFGDWVVEGYEQEFAEANYTQSYYDNLLALIEKNNGAMTKAEALAVAEELKAAMEALRKNVALYNELWGLVEADEQYVYDTSKFDYDQEFYDLFEDIYAMFSDENYTKTNEELEKLLADYKEARQRAQDNAGLEPGQDVTDKLINPHFVDANGNSSFTGWTIDSDGGFQNNAGNSGVVEQWNGNTDNGKDIDVWQEVRLMHKGAYRLETKGWYRCDNANEAYAKWANGDKESIGYLYASYSKDAFHNVFEHFYEDGQFEGGFVNTADGATPNNVTAANSLFNGTNDWDMVVDFISLGEPTKLGIKGENLPSHAWIIWDDFKLTYLGDDLATMQDVAVNEANAALELVNEPMSKEAQETLTACIEAIENAATEEALLDAYKDINDALDVARKSIANYKNIQKAIDQLDNALYEYAETATAEAIDNADQLVAELEKGIADGSIKDSEVDEVLARVKNAIMALKMPKNMSDATEENPIDCTSLIVNPRYFNEETGAATLEGWIHTGDNGAEPEMGEIGYAEGWGNTKEDATFDIHQDFTGMPEGTYKVMVNGLFRQGGTAMASKIFQYGYAEKLGKLDMISEEAKKDVPEATHAGQFYANGDYKPLKDWLLIGTDEWDEKAQEVFQGFTSEGNAAYVDSLTTDEPIEYQFPNLRSALYERALEGYYENTLWCYVGSDGKLTIGACNQNATDGDWTPFSNWRLYYEGTESSHESTTGIREAETTTGKIEAIYSIDGRRMNALQKGMNIVVVNGKAKKIMVK